MTKLNVKSLGLALGATFALLYLGGVITIALANKEANILFYNSLMPGIDVTVIARTDMPLWEMVVGLIEMFVLGWLIGAITAAIYNYIPNKS